MRRASPYSVDCGPGPYALKAEFPGFEPRIHPDVRARGGDNKETISLATEKLADTVDDDTRAAVSTRTRRSSRG
jgi:hypothetical protein